MASLKQKVVRGAFWALLERFSTQIVSFVVGIVLARMLTPSDYGTVALLGIFISVSRVLADSGFGAALIQKKDASDLDFNSVFYFSLVISTILYCLLFAIAPYVARFYNMQELCPILRVVACTLFFNAVNSVQNAELNRNLLFYKSFRISIISTIASSGTGLVLAFLDYGAWSLVWMGVVGGFVGVVTRWIIIAWRPRLMFSGAALKPLFTFGWKMSVSGLLDTSFSNLYGLIIGKWYTREDLSFVNKGRHMPELLMSNINGTLGRVAFPALAKIQDDRVKLRETMRRMMVVSTFVVFPLMMLVATTSKNTILLLYGEKWLPAAPYAIIACFTFALWPFHTINLQGIQAIGRSDVFLKLEIIKKAIGLAILLIFLRKSVFAWCLAAAFMASPLSVVINAWPNRKLLNYTLAMQIVDVLPTAIICGIVAFPVIAMNYIPISSQVMRLGLLLGQGMIALVLFLFLAFLLRLRGLREIALIVNAKTSIKIPHLDVVFRYLDA